MVFNQQILPFYLLISWIWTFIDPVIVLSMFMLSFTFSLTCSRHDIAEKNAELALNSYPSLVIVCVIFEWNLCRIWSFVYICISVGDPIIKRGGPLEIQLLRGVVLELINWFNPTTLLCRSQACAIIICHGLFLSSMIWGQRLMFVLLILVELLTITV